MRILNNKVFQNDILIYFINNFSILDNYTDPPSETIYNIIVADYEFSKQKMLAQVILL